MKKEYDFSVWHRSNNKEKKSPYCKCVVKTSMDRIPELCSVCFKRMPEKGIIACGKTR